MVKTVVAIPYREADERRKELFNFTAQWLADKHEGWSVHVGASPDGPFNRGAAINDAVRQADNWDIAVVHDADNICDPATLRFAVHLAVETGKVIYPFETYTYLDEYTSNRLMRDGCWFIAPEQHPAHGYRSTVRHHHYSGIQVIPRTAWDAVGGYIELTGWGAEDAIMNTVFEAFTPGVHWTNGGAYHLWHKANRNNPRDANNVRNHQIWSRVDNRRHNQSRLREYLATVGYVIP